MKKIMSTILLFVIITCFATTAFAAEEINYNNTYEKTIAMTPFMTKDIPQQVKDVAKDYKSLCNLPQNDQYVIDLDNALLTYNGFNVFGQPTVDQSIKYYTFNIGYKDYMYGQSLVSNFITISFNGIDAKYVGTKEVGPQPEIGRTDGYPPICQLYTSFYEGNIIFNDYLTSINSTNKPILVSHFNNFYIYEPVSQSIMLTHYVDTSRDDIRIAKAIFSMEDIRNYLNEKQDYSNTATTITEAMVQIDPIYGIKPVIYDNPYLRVAPAGSTPGNTVSGSTPSSTVSVATSASKMPTNITNSASTVPNVDTGYASNITTILGVFIIAGAGLLIAKKVKS